MRVEVAPARKAADRYHHGDLRQAIVLSALDAIERDGPEGVSLKALAKALGVSQPAPYRHFVNREAVLVAVAAQGFRRFSAAMRAAQEGAPHALRLQRIARAYVAFAQSNRGLYRLMFGSRLLAGCERDSELGQAASESFDLLLGALGRRGRRQARRRAALGFWARLHGLVELQELNLLSPFGEGATTLDELVADAVTSARAGSGSGRSPT